GAAPDRLRVRPRADRRHPARQQDRRRAGARPVQVLRRGRVPGREPAAEAAARRVAGRPRRPVRGRRPAPGDLLLHRGHPVLPDRLHRRVPRRHRGPPGARLPLHAPGGRGGQPAGPSGYSPRGAAAGRPAAGAHRVPGRDRGGGDPLPSAVRHVLTGMGLTAAPAAGHSSRERWESLTAIAQLADDMHAARPEATLSDFSAELTQRSELGHAPAVDGVTLASMHAAKGLEWDAVLLPGLVEGLMPIVHAKTPGAIEEERRLLYVAVTRAREHLYLSWSPARAPAGRG